MTNVKTQIETSIETAIIEVFKMLQDRRINPAGEFDKQGRFYAKNSNLISVQKL